jgi:hypothetical protein
VFEKRVLRGIFGPRKDEIIGGWTKFTPSIITKSRRMGLVRHVARMEMNS